MNSQDNSTIKKERKQQIKGFLEAIRTENNAIGKRLASIVALVGTIRASQLGIDIIITDVEEKLGK